MIAGLDYAQFLEREYLASFVANGGGAVKFVVAGDDASVETFTENLRAQSRSGGYAVVRVDAAVTRVQMMDQVFFAIAQQIDWDSLARATLRSAFAAVAHPLPTEGGDVTLAAVSSHYGVDPAELLRDVNRHLQHTVYRDYAMVQEFRIAMLRLCQAQMATGQVSDAEHAAVLDWLRGDLRQMSLVRSASIFRRVGRNNARHLLFSLGHWLSINGQAGLLLELDIRRLGFARRPQPEERSGLYYTKSAILDAYELLRQFVDNTDELSHCAVVVLVAPEFVTDPARGVDAYQALKLRIFDEVRDLRRDNPFSSMVRLGEA